jgi:hypothetical protein
LKGFLWLSGFKSTEFTVLQISKVPEGALVVSFAMSGICVHRLFPKQGKLLQSQLRTGKTVIKINGSACIRRVQQSLTGIDAGIQDLW